jgi:hypothetical protein
MNLVKTYENFMEFNPDFAVAKIKHFYSDYDVKNMVDDEIENWVEDSQVGDNYEGKVDWYYDNGSGEIEEVVIDQIINWYEKEFKKELDDNQREELYKRLVKEYPGIDPNNY